jgi:hypothetical protein
LSAVSDASVTLRLRKAKPREIGAFLFNRE